MISDIYYFIQDVIYNYQPIILLFLINVLFNVTEDNFKCIEQYTKLNNFYVYFNSNKRTFQQAKA